ncbi:MAG: hypothetical protein ACTSRS_01420 [Candidatus Helarchaeota archaeon]
MTKTLRKVGGAIELGGCGIYFMLPLMLYIYPYAEQKLVPLIFSITIFIMATIGGILLLLNKTIGGILSLLAAGMIAIGSFIPWIVPGYSGWLTSTFLFDLILIAAGGIIGIIAGSNKHT